ncbi:autotransporter domain-containing protein [Erwinia sp. CPCC 100877]|nr:autotransporter domain-containing protein [Erwinia sp. CPCC 100877]
MLQLSRKKSLVCLSVFLGISGSQAATVAVSQMDPAPEDTAWTQANGISADGSVLVGYIGGVNGNSESAAFWAGDNYGTEQLLNSDYSSAFGISDDKSTIVGFANIDTLGNRAMVWRGTEQIDLGSLRSDIYGNSVASAISADGTTIVGSGDSDAGPTHAAVWSGADYGTKQDLGTLRSDNGGISQAMAVSGEGDVVAGVSATDSAEQRAAVWSGDSLATQSDLGTLRADNSGHSMARALSDDGSVVAGEAETDTSNTIHATVWSGVNWSAKTDLGTLRADNSGNSVVYALSDDGRVAVGQADSDDNVSRATWWSGENYETKVDLGTLTSGNWGSSVAYAVSADGTVAAGQSVTETGNTHAVVWKIVNDTGTPTNNPEPQPAPLPTPDVPTPDEPDDPGEPDNPSPDNPTPPDDPEQPDPSHDPAPSPTPTPVTDPSSPEPSPAPAPQVIMVDATNTLGTVAQLSGDTFSVMEMQRWGLGRLQEGCQWRGQGDLCYSIYAGMMAEGGNRDAPAGIRMGYGITDNFAVGGSLEHSLDRSLPESYRKNNNNIGMGIYGVWHAPLNGGEGEWYLRGALAGNRFDVSIRRPHRDYTESGRGDSDVKGWSVSLEGGQNLQVWHQHRAGWYAGLRYSDLQQSGYTEKDVIFPVDYDDVNYRTTSAYLGGHYSIPLSEEVVWVSRAEVEQDLDSDAPSVSANVPWMGEYRKEADISHTRGEISSGLVWNLNQDMQISLMPSVGRSALSDTVWGGTLSFSGHFR